MNGYGNFWLSDCGEQENLMSTVHLNKHEVDET